MRSLTNNLTLFDAKAENGTSTVIIDAASYRNTLITVFAANWFYWNYKSKRF